MLSGIRQEFSLRTRSFWEKTLFWKAKQGPGCSFRPIKTTSCEHVTKREGSQLWCHKTPERWLLWKLTVPPSLEWLMSPHEFENKVVSFRQHLPNWWFPPRGLQQRADDRTGWLRCWRWLLHGDENNHKVHRATVLHLHERKSIPRKHKG